MSDIEYPAIDREPGQPEVYYLDHPTRERVLAKQGAVKEVAKPARKATKKTAKKKG
jgi:hypothetical protein